mgnify:CR=1 FL=1
MAKNVNVQVSIRETNGDVNRLIRKFIKKCKKERIIENYLDRRFYEKPSVRKRREKLKKRKNAKKAAQERSARQNNY